VQFNLSWQNSWRTSTTAPFNWDAAWVFVKYKVGTTGDWKHATLSTSGHTIPSGASSTQTDAAGIFIYRSVDATGAFSQSGIQLLWNYGTDGVANDSKITVRVFAIEMVYNQVGGFQAGSGGQNTGELRTATDVSTTGTAATFTVTGTSPSVQGNSSSASPTNIAARANASSDLTGTSTASLASGYPTGFNAFYAMKYEISQQQYVDFLNTLTYTQQAARTIVAPNSAAGTPALVASNANRNGVDIQSPGTASTIPAIYACNLNGTGSFNESDDGQHIACNYLSWDDLTAYLDWAALRPLTELEYEKSCRGGNQNPAASEFAWGNTSATALSGLSNASTMSETASSSSANIAYNNAYTLGPVRTGIFATGSTARLTSGAGFYGNMELSGNLWERVVTLGNPTGRTFSGVHGNGTLTSGGAADVSGWPVAGGTGWKGGSWLNATTNSATTSDRAQAANTDNTRSADAGGRGVRTISSGIVTDGLVLWLDAGITSSYPTSGTTWTDLSGNKNNGTLTNGPTYNNSNGGNIVFDGVNDFVILPPNTFGDIGSQDFSVEFWIIKTGTNSNDYARIFQPVDGDIYGAVSISFLTTTSNAINCLATTNGTAWNIGDPLIAYGTLVNGVYNHCVFTRLNNVFTFYTNTVSTIVATNNSALYYNASSTTPVIGGQSSASFPRAVNGRIASLKLYKGKGLSASEVLQNYNAQKARFGL
jgi:formylglycine-generating enzyme required for sulfatase activity